MIGKEKDDIELWSVEASSNGFIDALEKRRDLKIRLLIKEESEEHRSAIKELEHILGMVESSSW